jgi:AcrR family transcriptional regulator
LSTPRGRASVTTTRAYHSPRRARQAELTRTAIVDAAERLFLRDGLATTTVATIAAEASVSVETVYKTFGGKPGLVRAICERGLAGAGPVHAETRSDELRQTESDPRAIIRGWGRLSMEVAPRVAPILLLLRAAAADPQMAALQSEVEANRLDRMTHNARGLAEAGHLAAGVTAQHAGEVMWAYSSADLYELLVIRRGWPLERYGAFIADAMIAALLP